MSKEEEDEVGLNAKLWKPSNVLKAAEDRAVLTAKFLHARKARLERRPERASVEDAIALAELIIILSRYGREQVASQAYQITAKVEILMAQLAAELENLY